MTVIALVSPSINQVSPQVVTAGTPNVTVTVQGANFQSQSSLTVNGTAVPTTFVNSTTLAAKISGTTLAQPAVQQLQVRNSNGAASNEVPFTVANAPLTASSLSITTTVLPGAQAGTSYSLTLNASGGTPGYTWSIANGSLPAGLTLSKSGLLSGTPSGSGTSSFSVMVTDSGSPAQNQTVAMSIGVLPVSPATPTLSVGSATMGSAQVGSSYAVSLNATGGTPGYVWSLASGSLPAGLALSSAGVISGTPTASGTATFMVSVKDSGSPVQTASAQESITVAPSSVTISSTSLTAGQSGSPYSTTLSAIGGMPGYTWSIASGSLPAGLTLSSAGLISGTPTANGTATFTVAVKDSGSPVQTASAQESITVAGPGLTITSTSLGAAQTSSSYSTTLSASGGTPGYTWSVASGSLPAGLALSSGGVISGTPTAIGTATFTVSVKDSGSPVQTASTQESITVAGPGLTITSTNLGSAKNGSSYSTTLSASGGTPGYTWSIASGSLPAGLSMSSGGVISGTPTASGTATFTVGVKDSGSPMQTTSAQESITVAAASSTLTITSTNLSAAQNGGSYSATLAATGGTPSYTWSVTSGTLPAGLQMSSGGVISGTPTANGTATFTVGVQDSGSPVQTASAQESITVSATQLAVTTSSLSSGTSGSSYSTTLNATGGTPSYTWSVTSGSLPAGLSLSSAGVISGTPTATGTSNFTVGVSDSSSPVEAATAQESITVTTAQASGPGTTWYIRQDGGTRYSSKVPNGQCDGQADVAYPGSGVNQHCAFNDFRYLWDDDSGAVGAGQWVIAGGDTVIIRGCTAQQGQTNASNPNCRIGWDGPTGPTSDNWCYGVGSYTCYNPPIPAGTSTQHTRILGQNYANCNASGATNPKNYVSNLTQLFGGYGLVYTFNLQNTQNVDIQCIELTTHNGICSYGVGAPAYPRGCNSSQPVDDFAQNGFLLNNKSAGINFQDVYVHGFNSSGFMGPIGGSITMTRVFSGFNAFSGWNFDDGSDTADAAGSSITAKYVTMIGNGCYEEYPIVHGDYPARACYDPNSAGFGDAWSGQDTELDSFVCDHCVMMYNTKDGFIGPHTQVKNMSITNSVSIGNMGAQWKWGQTTNATLLFQNNLTVTNCIRMAETLPGAGQNFNQSTGQGGSYLTNFCRAGGNGFAMITRNGSTNHFYGNTIIGASNIIFEQNCGYYTPGNVFNQETNCGSVPLLFEDNNFLGYTDPSVGVPTALFYADEGTTINFTSSYNNEYGLKNGTTDPCGTNHIACSDPLLVNEPAQSWPGSETALDVFNPFVSGNSFTPSSSSPLLANGVQLTGMSTDYVGNARPANPSIGAIEP